jgi:hypothetical protein
MGLHLDPMPDDRKVVAVMYGPLVLAGRLGTKGPTPEQLRAATPAPEGKPADAPWFAVESDDPCSWIRPVAGKSLEFRTCGQATDVTLVPLARLFGECFAVYWDVLRKGSPEHQSRLAADQRRKELEARTIDAVEIGQRASESTHAQAGERTETGGGGGRWWRHAAAGGWFSYRLKVLSGQPAVLCCTYWGGDVPPRKFDLVVDGARIATQDLNRNKPGEFFDVEYPIPAQLTRGKQNVTVRFQAHPGNIAGGLFGLRVLAAGEAPSQPATVLDRLWIWTHPAGAHDGIDLGGGRQGKSRMKPVEGADYLGVPNLYFIHYPNNPPISQFRQCALDFRPMKRVVWSLTGAGGDTSPAGREAVLKLAGEFPNISGFVLDDFLHWSADSPPHRSAELASRPVPASMTPDQLEALQKRIAACGRKLPIACVVYTHQISPRILPHVNRVDKVAMWTWRSEDLGNLEANFEKLRRIVPSKPILLGCYLFDYGNNKPMTVDRMRRQCEFGLKWLREGKIEGMIFLASNVCDMNLPAVEWTRQWIVSVAREKVSGTFSGR